MIRLFVLFVSLVFVSGCNPVKKTVEAEKAVGEFHALFNAEDFDKIFDDSHADFKATGTKADIVAFMVAVRAKMGPVQSTERSSWNVKAENGATWVVLTQTSVFENGSGDEEFTFQMDGGKALLVGWHVAPELAP